MNDPKKVNAITDAYSMQPQTYRVNTKFNGKTIDRIVLETAPREGDAYECYVGYDSTGLMLFRFWKHSVNILN